MTRRILNSVFLLIAGLTLLSCNGGIEPAPAESEITGFSGKITFLGTWPQGIKRTHLVAFINPIREPGDFFPPNLSIILDSVAYGTREFYYDSALNNFIAGGKIEPGEYAYVVVAQSKTENLSLLREDWTVAGVYYSGNNNSIPGLLKIEKDKTTKNVNITCDFNNPPPQPPGGR